MGHALQRRNYIPLGTQLSERQVARIPLTALRQRSIYDPRYAGFEESFDWRHYVDLDIRDGAVRQQVETALGQFATTARGQQILRQSLAMQTFRETGRLPRSLAEAATHRVLITDCRKDQTLADHADDATQFDGTSGTIYFNMYQTARREVWGQDWRYHDMTVQDTLFHELAHSADGFNTDHNKTGLHRTHGAPYQRFMQSLGPNPSDAVMLATYDERTWLYNRYIGSALEHPVIRATNQFMGEAYQRPPQEVDHTAWRRDETAQGDFFYEQLAPMRTPTVPAARTTAMSHRP